VLQYFSTSRKEAVKRYEEFVQDGVSQGRRPDLSGGGLVRSVGGWSEVLSFRRKGRRVSYDDRILGSSDFVQRILEDAEVREKESLRLSSKIPDLDSLALMITQDKGMSVAELCSGSKKREIVMARRLFCQAAVKLLGYSGAEVARFLGVTTSAVNRSASSDLLTELEKFNEKYK
jgi:hypothetical protein